MSAQQSSSQLSGLHCKVFALHTSVDRMHVVDVMDIPVELNGAARTAKVVFAGKADLHFVNDWRKSLGDDQNPLRVDAVDFAQLAVYRFEAHSAIEAYAKSIGDIGDHIGYSPQAEVASLVLLKCDWFPDSEVIGIAHFRRTWSNRIVLDYLAAHPFSVRPPDNYPNVVRGVGPGLLYFLSVVAKKYECEAIWGEATQGSCGFYRHVLKLDSVEDLIYAPREKFLNFIDRMDADRQEEMGTTTTSARAEMYAAETQNPPFVGSKTAVFNPARRLANRFMELPHHVQREIAEGLELVQEEDRARPSDEQFSVLFRRATEEGKLGDLWRRVEEKYPDGEPEKNPFPNA
jgi:hypothetical protein